MTAIVTGMTPGEQATVNQKRLHIVVPGEPRGPFLSFLTTLALETERANGTQVTIVNPRGSDLVGVRTTGARAALENGATHILWVDSDMIMKPDAALRLMAHDLPVVAANYVTRTTEFVPVSSDAEGQRVFSVNKSGLEEVNATGMGLFLTDAAVYRKMRFPWFGHRWFFAGDKDPVQIGPPDNWGDWPATFEDAYFCDRIREAGYKIYIDHDLSLQVGHYGGCIYYHAGIESA
jgi:hypothetical protein